MSIDLTTPATDLVTDDLTRLVEQFKNKPNFNAVLAALVGPHQALSDVAYALFNDRTLDSAVGAQLDGLAEIVNIAREASDDDDLRLRIRVELLLVRSAGRYSDVIEAIALIYGVGAEVLIDYFDPLVVEGTRLRLLLDEQLETDACVDTGATRTWTRNGSPDPADAIFGRTVGNGSRLFNGTTDSFHAPGETDFRTLMISGEFTVYFDAANTNVGSQQRHVFVYGGRSGAGGSINNNKNFAIRASPTTFVVFWERAVDVGVNAVSVALPWSGGAAKSFAVHSMPDPVNAGRRRVIVYHNGSLLTDVSNVLPSEGGTTDPVFSVGGTIDTVLSGSITRVNSGWFGRIGPVDVVEGPIDVDEIARRAAHQRTIEVTQPLEIVETPPAAFIVTARDPLPSDAVRRALVRTIKAARAAGVRADLTSYQDSEYVFGFDGGDNIRGFDEGGFARSDSA